MEDFTITHIGDTALSLPMPFKYIPAKGKTFMFQADDGSNLWSKNKGIPITFDDDFWICIYPTTQEFWAKVRNADNQALVEDGDPSFFKGKHRPVESINWEDTVKFIKAINQSVNTNSRFLKIYEGDMPSGKFRLPSETHWEYAADADQGLLYSGSQNLDDVGWYKQNSNEQTMPVGLKQPNNWGLYDMSGNVWEWCHFENRKINSNGEVFFQTNTNSSSIRGGSCLYFPQRSNSRFLDSVDPNSRYANGGFRLCFSNDLSK